MKPKLIFLPLLTSLLFAGSFVAAKYAIRDLGPLTIAFLRYVIALGFLSCLLPKYRMHALRLRRNDWWWMLLLGLFGIVGYHYFFFVSLRYTPVANTAIINAFSPVVTGILATCFIGERLTGRNYLGILGACMGVLLLLARGNLDYFVQLRFNLGDLLMLCAVLSWAVYAILVKTLLKRYSGFTLTFYAALCGVLMLFFFALSEKITEQIPAISMASVYAVLYMGAAASGAGYLLYNLSIKKIGPTRTAGFVYGMVPIFVAIAAFVFFAEEVTTTMIFSALLVIAGLHFMLGGK